MESVLKALEVFMKYMGMPMGMWKLFERSFEKQLSETLGYQKAEASKIKEKALKEYKRIIAKLPEFEKGDRFKMNIVSCAMFSAFCLHMQPLPETDKLAAYYEKAMMIKPMILFCKLAGKTKFSEKDLAGMRQTAAFKAADRNPYSWNMELFPYEDGSGYEARFDKCGICTLMKELGLWQAVPAMCQLDYAMSKAGEASDFVRQYALASGGPYCDCGYKKKVK